MPSLHVEYTDDSGPSWEMLRHNPAEAFRNLSKTPRGFCDTTARWLTRSWAERHVAPLLRLERDRRVNTEQHGLNLFQYGERMPTGLSAWPLHWPLPIGRDALMMMAGWTSNSDLRDYADALSIDPGWSHGNQFAALILTIPIRDATITFFGLAHPTFGNLRGTSIDGHAPLDAHFPVGEVTTTTYTLRGHRSIVVGEHPTSHQAKTMVEQLVAPWWRSCEGREISPHPGASPAISIDDVRNAIRKLAESDRSGASREDPTQSEVAELLRVDARTVRARCDENDYTYKQLVAEVVQSMREDELRESRR